MKVFVILFVVGSCIAHLHAQGGRTGGGAAADDQPEDGIWTEDDIISEEHVNDHVQNVHYLYGDIRVTPEQEEMLERDAATTDAHPATSKRAVVKSVFALWPNEVVPYVLSSSLNTKARNAIRSAIATYHSESCVRFVERNGQKDYIYFFSENGCWSYIGRVGGRQEVSIGRGCEYEGIVLHELFHVLGRWHEQSRSDRDLYIKVNYKNIKPGTESNFGKVSASIASTQGVPYDYTSIMHYDAWAFSRNRQPTIEPKDNSVPLNNIGQRNDFSGKDLQHINALYCEDAPSAPAPAAAWSAWSACTRSCNGGSQIRTRTCVGCQGNNFQIRTCNTNPCPGVVASWSQWTQWSACSVSCGGGRRTRERSCQNGNSCSGNGIQYGDCNAGSCPNDLAGMEQLGCYLVVTTGANIGLLEGATDELLDHPFFRQDAVGKCSRAADENEYEIFAVAYGYCISGSSDSDDYMDGGESTVCSKGIGGYTRVGYSMDVYRITNSSKLPQADVPQDSPAFADAVPGGDDGEGGGLMPLGTLLEESRPEAASSAVRGHGSFGALLVITVLLMSHFLFNGFTSY